MTMRKSTIIVFYFVCDACGACTPRAGSPVDALELASEAGDDWEIVPSSPHKSELHFCGPECLAAWEKTQ